MTIFRRVPCSSSHAPTARTVLSAALLAAPLALSLAVGPAAFAQGVPSTGAGDARAPVEAAIEQPTPGIVDDLLEAGRVDIAVARLAALDQSPAAQLTRLRVLLRTQDYARALPLLDALKARPAASLSADERSALYDGLRARDDLAEIDRRTSATIKTGQADSVDLLAAGELATALHQDERAKPLLERALQAATTSRQKGEALRALGQWFYQQRDFDTSFKRLEESLAWRRSAETLGTLAETLIRLARTGDAIDAARQALDYNPYDEHAHYLLGNGYARRNYTELRREEPARFAEAEALARRASDALEAGAPDQARALAIQALSACPGYGRGHAILAKALEFQRLAIDVHRADYEARFAAMPMPRVPGIERYVLNWASLTPRIQKRVALSVAPWRAYIPVLVEGSATHYIKPMWQRLSETPGLESLRDARIDTDSRLWDDVRGAGGHNTVTGYEDVERLVSDRYNTVLHELSHQVHGVLGPDDWRGIESLYRAAKARDAKTGKGFLSRYAGGTVWEYFAEGVNAQASPRRDVYDTREITRERLAERDPDLQRLVLKLLARTDARASLPIAMSNEAARRLETGDVEGALAQQRKALALAPRNEAAQLGMLRLRAIRGDRAEVAALADAAIRAHGASANARIEVAAARRWLGTPIATLVGELRGARRMNAEDSLRVNLAVGGYLRDLGDVDGALAAYDAALAAQGDKPEALWGKAKALALAGRWEAAFALYDRVVRERSGLVELRVDHAQDLLMAGRRDAAREALRAAALLDPEDPSVLALQGWLALQDGEAALALKQADQALAIAPWLDLAEAVRGAALRRLDRAAEADSALKALRERLVADAPPTYVYFKPRSTWVLAHANGQRERQVFEHLGVAAPR